MDRNAQIESLLSKSNSFKAEIGQDIHDRYVENLYVKAAEITAETVKKNPIRYLKDEKIDKILTSKLWGFPTMVGLFTVVIWLTIEGANVPSGMLASLFLDTLYPFLIAGTEAWPWWLSGLLIDGMYLATAWVISVMLPPMAIFFPMFTCSKILDICQELPSIWMDYLKKQELTENNL